MINLRLGLGFDFNGGSSPPSPILDTLSVAAAYSLRKLRTAYTGFCIRVRRSGDNTEQNIGFVSGVLDTSALLAFVGGGSGFVVTWYDQSVNALNATQATAANQPRIVSSGVLDVQNTKACMRQIASSMWLDLPNIMTGATSATAVIVYNQPTTGNGSGFNGWGLVNSSSLSTNNHTPWSDGLVYDGFCSTTRGVFTGYGSRDNLRIHTIRHTGSALQCFRDGAQVDTDKSATFNASPFNNRLLNGTGQSVYFSDDSMCEAVFFGSAISTSNRQLLEANQKAYYGTP